MGLDHLTDLFLDGHPAQEFNDSRLDRIMRQGRLLGQSGKWCIHEEKSPEQMMCQSSACRVHEVSSPARHRDSLQRRPPIHEAPAWA